MDDLMLEHLIELLQYQTCFLSFISGMLLFYIFVRGMHR